MTTRKTKIHITQILIFLTIIFLSILLVAIDDLDEPAYRAGEAVLSLCVAILSLIFATVQLLRKRPTRSKVLLALNILLGALCAWMLFQMLVVNVAFCSGVGCGISSAIIGLFGVVVDPDADSAFQCDTDTEVGSVSEPGLESATESRPGSRSEHNQSRSQSQQLVPTPEEPEAEARAERQEQAQKETDLADVELVPRRRSWGILVPEGKAELAW
ncbi:hypothetical protein BDV06DRAFT_223565 [Aspergillus oleicola]